MTKHCCVLSRTKNNVFVTVLKSKSGKVLFIKTGGSGYKKLTRKKKRSLIHLKNCIFSVGLRLKELEVENILRFYVDGRYARWSARRLFFIIRAIFRVHGIKIREYRFFHRCSHGFLSFKKPRRL